MNDQTTGRALSPTTQTLISFRENMEGSRDKLKKMLPAHVPVERFMRVVDSAIQQNPKILEATARSIFNAAMKAATDGLLPDGREGAIVPYNVSKKDAEGRWYKEVDVQWMPMIAGIRKKVRNSGEIATWDAQIVHENDEFAYELGDEPFIKHRPKLDGDRGAIIGAYSIATLKSGEKSREFMTISEIEGIRERSKAKDSGPWKTDYAEMCRKTVARRHSKVLPMSTDLDDLIRRDDGLYDFEGRGDGEANANAALQRPQPPSGLVGKMAALAANSTQPMTVDHDDDGVVIETQANVAPTEQGGLSGDVEAAQGSGARQDEGVSPHTPSSTVDPVDAARKAGAEAKAAGKKRSSVPAEYKQDGREEEYDAWLEGFEG